MKFVRGMTERTVVATGGNFVRVFRVYCVLLQVLARLYWLTSFSAELPDRNLMIFQMHYTIGLNVLNSVRDKQKMGRRIRNLRQILE